MASIYRKQRGQVLWGLLVMLTMMTELAISSLQMAAHEGLSVRVMEQRFQQRQWLELMAQQLERLPVQWRLSQRPDVVAQVQEGSDLNAFPLLNAQMWQLELVSVGRAVASPRGLLLRYRQVAP